MKERKKDIAGAPGLPWVRFFDAQDERIGEQASKVHTYSKVTAACGVTMFILLHELCKFVALPTTGGMLGNEIGMTPFIMSGLLRGLCVNEFSFNEDSVPSKLYFQLTLIAFYVGQWSYQAFMTWPLQGVVMDTCILLCFTIVVRYVDVVVSHLSNQWISLVHASICVSHASIMLPRLAVFPDCIVVVVCFVVCYVIVTQKESVNFRSLKHRNYASIYDIPFMYNGSTSIIYAETLIPAFAGMVTLAVSSTTLLHQLPMPSFVSEVIGNHETTQKFFESSVGIAVYLAIITIFELRLPRMQGRDANGIIKKYEEKDMTLNGWRMGSTTAKTTLAKKIWSTQKKALSFSLATKVLGLSGALILAEQFHSVPFRAAYRKLPRSLRAPFLFLYRQTRYCVGVIKCTIGGLALL